MKVAVIQMDIVYGNPQANFEHITSKIREACSDQTDVIVLPELWTTGYDLEMLDQIGDPNGEKTIEFISSLAISYHVNIVAGSVAVRKEKDVFNTMLVFDREGNVHKEYSKVHLFRLMNEEKYLKAGNDDGHFTIDDIPAAGFICYDIRFPEWIRKHALEGAKVLFVPAEWPKPRTEHWRNLLITRAIENQCYVVACNRVGSDPDNVFGGHSMIINPWGEILSEADEDETTIYANIQIEELNEFRKRIPIYEDRRTDLYE
ncbi:carbon-nitrogen family hydrolase [Pseudalkalibacillus berkeleyi]|uniref:Carbon-nitrogen family hydrolase n=1 Tax=Pseudalkalibacillus berkeleyi TaxID=1069813 RepID=A0ABS9GY93_9BACL|nr:carbon-nitrogen family hydrolase [Pseudalkalibacillus berkeleyi]MCF6136786.1 carbon-nitrogen family hydrolase [Pseudalkalibacillus berkeleyi]